MKLVVKGYILDELYIKRSIKSQCQHYNVSIDTFLENKKKRVAIKNLLGSIDKSTKCETWCTTRIIARSILFIVREYINDISINVPKSKITMFADDTVGGSGHSLESTNYKTG